MCCIEHDFAFSFGIRANQGPTTRGGDHLVAVERKHAVAAERTENVAVESRPKSFCGIFNHGNFVFVGDRHDLIDPVGHAVKSDRNDCLGLFPGFSDTILNGLFEQYRIHVPALRLGVYENRSSTQIGYGV